MTGVLVFSSGRSGPPRGPERPSPTASPRPLLVHWPLLAVVLWVVVALVPSVEVSGGLLGLAGAALVFGLVNAMLLMIAAGFSDALSVGGPLGSIVAALAISILTTVLQLVLRPWGR